MCLLAVRQYGRALKFASADLQQDPSFVKDCVAANGWALAAAKSEFQNDPQVVMLACTGHGSVLKFASEKMKASRDLVLKAVASQGSALQYAAPSLRNGMYEGRWKCVALKRIPRLLLFLSHFLPQPSFVIFSPHFALYCQ